MKPAMFLQEVYNVLRYVKKEGIYPDIFVVSGAPTNPEVDVVVEGEKKKVLMFSSNNYLGLANDPRVKTAVARALEIYGTGSGGSRLVSGNIELQLELEKNIAEFKGYNGAITYATGYMANTGAIPALLNPPVLSASSYLKRKFFIERPPVVISDELNHASIIDGCRLAKADRAVFKHKDLNDLERVLKKYKHYPRKMIVSDGVFSMDGDIAPLPGIMALGERYGAAVMIDDAHATGVLGENGRGTAEHFKLKKHPDIMMGTFTKAFGAVGGFIAGSRELADYLRVTSRSHIFSAPIPPLIVAGILEALAIIKEERRFETLRKNLEYIFPLLKQKGFNTMESETQIIPILIGSEETAIKVSRALLAKGIFAPAIRWPAVPKGQSRLRITIMSSHIKEHLDRLIGMLQEVRSEYPF